MVLGLKLDRGNQFLILKNGDNRFEGGYNAGRWPLRCIDWNPRTSEFWGAVAGSLSRRRLIFQEEED